jgi:rhamnogalacturonan hydrolase
MCADGAPCTNVHIRDFAMWTDSGSSVSYSCQSAYGTGACLKPGSGGAYPTVKQTVNSPPANYKAQKMPWDLKQSFGTTTKIPVPDIPDHFFPGTKPIKALARGGGRTAAAPAAAPAPAPAKPASSKEASRDAPKSGSLPQGKDRGPNAAKEKGQGKQPNMLSVEVNNSTVWNDTEFSS